MRIGICDFYPNNLQRLEGLGEVKLFSKGYPSSHSWAVASCIKSYCPDCKLFMALGSLSTCSELEQMLLWLQDKHIDILNLSLAYRDKNTKIEEILQSMIDSGTVVFAAQNDNLLYPWSLNKIISVGKHGKIRLYRTNYEGLSGSSIACAVSTGIKGKEILE